MDLTSCTASQLARLIRKRQISVLEVVENHLARIAALQHLNAIVTVDAEGALTKARAADEVLVRSERVGPLHGVPFTLKDMHATAGIRTTAGLPALATYVPKEDGVAAERFAAAGAILLGKSNMAMNVESDGDLFGRPLNPYDQGRTTGGSSGGAAAALAARLIPLEVGTDMSGSIRMPSHYCGVYGFKPTANRIPSFGVIFVPDFRMPRIDRWFGTMGPMARSMEDLLVAFGVLAGPHPADPEAPPVPVRTASPRDPATLRIAVTAEIAGIPTSAEQRSCILSMAAKLESAGANVVEQSLPFTFDELLHAFRNLIRIPLQVLAHQGAGPPGSETLAESPLSAAALFEALDQRDDFIRRFETFLTPYDAWISPTTPDAAFPHRPRGEPIEVDGQTVSSQIIDHPCLPATYTGCPALVVPIALTNRGLPIGVQLHARRWCDEDLLDVGAAVASVLGPLPPPSVAHQG